MADKTPHHTSSSSQIDSREKTPDISHVRAEIDRVDNALLDLIAQRLELASAVRRAKSGVRVWRPSREESHVRDLSEATSETPVSLVSRIWAELMSASLAVQGPMRLHIALEGDTLDVWTLVRDRFGSSLPALSYPTASSALAAAYSESEGVAILPTPGGMNSWWAALCTDGAMPDMHILAGLPRTGHALWPRAVAVATAALQPSWADNTLIAVQNPAAITSAIDGAIFRGEAGAKQLFSLPEFIAPDSAIFSKIHAQDPSAKIIGCLPRPLGTKRSETTS